MCKLLSLVAVGVLLTGCTTAATYDPNLYAINDLAQGLSLLQGKQIETAVLYLGYPDQKMTLAGKDVYRWQNQGVSSHAVPHTSYQNGTVNTYGDIATYSGTATTYTTEINSHNCRVEIAVEKGIISDATYSGDFRACSRYGYALHPLVTPSAGVQRGSSGQSSASEKTASAEQKSDVLFIDAMREKAERGDANAQANLGSLYFLGQDVPQDYAQAMIWYRKAAENGNVWGQYGLGGLYDSGLGVRQDYAQAATWFRKAAEQGHADAQASLGLMYREGQGVPQDYAKALAWFRSAAEQGSAYAQFNLGSMHFKGQGVPQDYAKAYMWVNLAAAQGQSNALKARDASPDIMTPSQIEEGQRLTREWLAAHPKVSQ